MSPKLDAPKPNHSGPDDQVPLRLGRLLDEHAGPLALFASQWSDTPDDCVQEAFVALAEQDPWPENVQAWLYRVVRNRAISQLRSQQRRRKNEAVAARLTPLESNPKLDERLDAMEIAASLDELSPELREVLVARIWGKLTLEQIAAACEISISSAHRRYEAALAALRQRWHIEVTSPNPVR